jgi:sugar lactone lactonase YvrE
MKSLARLVALLALAAIVCAPAAAQKKGGGKKKKQAAAIASTAAPQPAGVAQPADTAQPTSTEPVSAENDPQRTVWRIDVQPYAVFGSGHPGKAAADFDKPDGVAFAPSGYLLATDAKNRRVQIWDVKTRTRVGEFGHKYFGGEIVDIAIAPSGLVLVTDQTLNLAYAFTPPAPGAVDKDSGKPLGPADYQFKGTRFGEQGFDKLGGIAIDSRGRVYCVDAHLNEVRRFTPDFQADDSFHFEKAKSGGDTFLHGCEGIAINEATGDLFVSSEKDSVVQIFDWESGAYKRKLLGGSVDTTMTPGGKRIFFDSVEGLAIARNHLFAVDEAAGHIQVFDLTRPSVYNADLVKFSSPRRNRQAGYLGFFGHSSKMNFEDKTNVELQAQVKNETIIPGQVNPPGYFCSPDSIASFTDNATGETYVAIADQCNYRLVVYRWSDLARTWQGSTGAQVATDGGGKGGKKGKKKP